MSRTSFRLVVNTKSKWLTPRTLEIITADPVQSGFTVAVPVNVSGKIVPSTLVVSPPDTLPLLSMANVPTAATGSLTPADWISVPLNVNPQLPSRLACVQWASLSAPARLETTSVSVNTVKHRTRMSVSFRSSADGEPFARPLLLRERRSTPPRGATSVGEGTDRCQQTGGF